jgi:hypothetical protein
MVLNAALALLDELARAPMQPKQEEMAPMLARVPILTPALVQASVLVLAPVEQALALAQEHPLQAQMEASAMHVLTLRCRLQEEELEQTAMYSAISLTH